MRVQVLGDLQVTVGDAVADLGGPKPRTLLALLVAAEGRSVPVEHLIDQIWGEEPPARAEASLQSYVARLRRVIEPERDVRAPAQTLQTRAGGYALEVGPDDVDARRFAALVRDARSHLTDDPDRGERLLGEALGLWQGRAYAGIPSAALEAEGTRLEELRLGVVEALWDLRIRRGHHAEAVGELEQLVRTYPLREQLWALLARALYRAARQGEALAALRRAREHLAEELGVDPGPELRRLEDAILRQDPVLDAPAVTATVAPASGPVAPVTAEEQGPGGGASLFGREAALAESDAVLAEAARGRGRTILVSGEPGIGKTRLTEALVARAEAAGFRTGRGGWEAEACPPLWGWTRALGQLLGRDDLLDPAAADVTDAASASFRQAAALVSSLRDGPPAVLVLDDVHWADTESVRLLRRFATELSGLPVALVLALRSTPADIGEPVADLLGALARLDPLRVDLSGLDPAAITAWVDQHAGMALSTEVAAELAERTDGNPFYVAELVRLLVSEGALARPGSEAWQAVPLGVRDVVRQRLGQLTSEDVDILTIAAVAGRSFDLVVVAEASGVELGRVEEAVESAQVLGLVDEEAPARYRFTHALVRDAARASLTAAARSRAHAAVAVALERAHGGQVVEHVAELAEHYRLAGPAHARSGWVFARKAAQLAAGRSAHDEAHRLFAQAASLQERDPTVEDREREEVLVGRVRALVRLGRPLDAWAPAEQAARTALARGDAAAAATALLAVTEGMVWGWRTHPEYDDDAVALWEEVVAAQPEADELTRAHLSAAIGVELLYRPGAADRATRLADRAIAVVRRSADRGDRALQVLRLAHMSLLRPDLLHHRIPLSDEVVELAGRLGDPSGLASALTGRAQDRAELGRLADVRSDVLRAQELADRHHLSQNWMVSGWCRAQLCQLDEDWTGTERAIGELEAFQATLAMSGEGIGLCQLSLLRDLQGRLPELEPTLREVAALHPGFRELHALSLVRSGRGAEARMLLGAWAEQPPLPWDYLWLLLAAIRAEVWVGLGDAEAARDLHETLLPYADRLAVSIAVGFRGSVHLVLGELAGVAGDAAAARQHLEEARRVHQELGLTAWVARADDALARWAETTGLPGPGRAPADP